jgi:hypothetical protein
MSMEPHIEKEIDDFLTQVLAPVEDSLRADFIQAEKEPEWASEAEKRQAETDARFERAREEAHERWEDEEMWGDEYDAGRDPRD